MATVKLSVNGFGGVIQGQFGTYVPAADGTVIVDTRDLAAMLQLGMNNVNNTVAQYTTPLPPAAATVSVIVASGALSDGTVAVAAQPDVLRPVNVVVGTGTTAITAGTITVTYVGNDGQSGVEIIPATCALSSAVTHTLSRGVDTITSVAVAGLVGGTAPWRHFDTTTALSLPVPSGVADVVFQREYDGGATIAVGAVAVTLASITPTTAPNGTLNYSFTYYYLAPNS
jgi:hypothetical protein